MQVFCAGKLAEKWKNKKFGEYYQAISDRILEKLKGGEMVYIVDYHWYDEFFETPSQK